MTQTIKKKILYLLTKGDTGGAQKYVADLIHTLDQEEFAPVVFYGGKDIRWLSNTTLPWLLFFNDWLALFELVRLYIRERPNIIHLNSSKAGVLGSLAASLYSLLCRFKQIKPPKVIFTAHGWVFNPDNHPSRFTRGCYVLLHRFAAHFQDVIINVSKYDQALALQYRIAPARKLVTIHNGIDLQLSFSSREEARRTLLQQIQRGSMRNALLPMPWIGSLGRLTKEKHYDDFIAVARGFSQGYFFLIGDGSEKTRLLSLVKRHHLENRFFIIPPQGNDSRFLPAFDIFMMTSIKEGLPYVLLEAMLARLPVIATNVGGIPEVVSSNVSGILLPKHDVAGMITTLQKLSADQAYQSVLGHNAQKTIQPHFALQTMITSTEHLYR